MWTFAKRIFESRLYEGKLNEKETKRNNQTEAEEKRGRYLKNGITTKRKRVGLGCEQTQTNKQTKYRHKQITMKKT